MKFLEATQTTLRSELKIQEANLKEAINEIKPVQITQVAPPPAVAPAVQPTPVAAPPIAVAPAPAPRTSPQDDRDFVPLQNPAPDAPEGKKFEGFAPDPNIAKAESAANALRAALEEGNL